MEWKFPSFSEVKSQELCSIENLLHINICPTCKPPLFDLDRSTQNQQKDAYYRDVISTNLRSIIVHDMIASTFDHGWQSEINENHSNYYRLTIRRVSIVYVIVSKSLYYSNSLYIPSTKHQWGLNYDLTKSKLQSKKSSQ